MAMKRERENNELEKLDVKKLLGLLSQTLRNRSNNKSTKDYFECKTCNHRFSSFQALGGHMTSHKRPKLMFKEREDNFLSLATYGNDAKPKVHECSMCGQVFSKGQALGGHMRMHRAAMGQGSSKMPVLRRSSSCKRVLCLDLNLSPLENDLVLLFGKKIYGSSS